MINKGFTLVLMRHGHTDWNLNNRFTGWSEVPLSETGIEEARKAGELLARQNIAFDQAYVSVLDRTRQALDIVLQAAGHPEIPVYADWRLNERHYGALQGMNKDEIFSTFGESQSYNWWRGYDISPPALEQDDPRHPRFNPLYQHLSKEQLPDSESLAQCKERLIPYWQETIMPAIQSGKKLIVVSHGNTLRSLRMHVEKIDIEDIKKVEIPSGIPFIYRFSQDMQLDEIEWVD